MNHIVERIWQFRKYDNLKDWMTVKFAKYINDQTYLKIRYKIRFGKELNFNNPTTFNEKLNWLKLYDRNPIYTMMADKYWVKQYVAKQIGSQYVVPCYGHWKCYSDIDFSKLPEKCFLKSNQDSGGGVLYDRSNPDFHTIKERFSKKRLSRNWFYPLREWGYKHIEPCILAEEYLDEGTGHEVHDYKFWCFNGKPTYMYITNKGKIIKENFYDMNFCPVEINHGFERTIPEYEKPKNFDKMIEFAKILSEDIPFVRIDFFDVKGNLYFGEFTFYDWGAFRPFSSEDIDTQLGKLIDLTCITFSK